MRVWVCALVHVALECARMCVCVCVRYVFVRREDYACAFVSVCTRQRVLVCATQTHIDTHTDTNTHAQTHRNTHTHTTHTHTRACVPLGENAAYCFELAATLSLSDWHVCTAWCCGRRNKTAEAAKIVHCNGQKIDKLINELYINILRA